MDKKHTINSIADRIKSEYRKHKDLDWSYIAACKIYNSFIMKEDNDKDKISNEDLLFRLQEEGESYAIKHYYGRDIECEDKTSQLFWRDAYDALVKLEEHLENKVK